MAFFLHRVPLLHSSAGRFPLTHANTFVLVLILIATISTGYCWVSICDFGPFSNWHDNFSTILRCQKAKTENKVAQTRFSSRVHFAPGFSHSESLQWWRTSAALDSVRQGEREAHPPDCHPNHPAAAADSPQQQRLGLGWERRRS